MPIGHDVKFEQSAFSSQQCTLSALVQFFSKHVTLTRSDSSLKSMWSGQPMDLL
jgi:hypothetical protein